MKILLIDNFDSFSYNLYQEFALVLGAEAVTVVRNNAISAHDLDRLQPSAIVISPGPGEPKDSGVSIASVHYALKTKTPLLGICLGHQVIAASLGAHIVRAPSPVHGHVHQVTHNGDILFQGVAQCFAAMRYHSLIVQKDSLPASCCATAETEDGLVMALRIKGMPIWGLQFHPESFLCPSGSHILRNFLALSLNDKALPTKSTAML